MPSIIESRWRKKRLFEITPRFGLLQIQKYIIIEILSNFILIFLIISFVFFVSLALQCLYKNPDISFFFMVKGFPFLIPYSFPYTIPMSFLVAVVLTYGRISADNEILAMQTTGVHVYWAVSPALLLGILLSLSAFLINDHIVPYSYFRKKTLVADAAEIILSYFRSGKRSFSIPKLKMHWDGYEGEDFTNCFIVSKGLEEKKEQRIFAKRCRISMDRNQGKIFFYLSDVTFLFRESKEEEKNGENLPADQLNEEKIITPYFGKFQISFNLEEILGLSRRNPCLEELKTAELLKLYRKKILSPEGSEIGTAIHKRLALSLAPLSFVLMGAPLGILFRRRNRLVSFLISFLLVILLYYPFVTFGEAMGCEGTLPPVLAMWSGNGFLAILGIVLLFKVFRK